MLNLSSDSNQEENSILDLSIKPKKSTSPSKSASSPSRSASSPSESASSPSKSASSPSRSASSPIAALADDLNVMSEDFGSGNFKSGKELRMYIEKLKEKNAEFYDAISMFKTYVDTFRQKVNPTKSAEIAVSTPNEVILNTPSIVVKRKRDSDLDISPEEELLITVEPQIQLKELCPRYIDEYNVQIGSNGTTIPAFRFNKINWTSAQSATRNLLSVVFDQIVLATHTLTGKPSPAFHGRERPPKGRLDPQKIEDIIECIMTYVPEATPREIRAAITTKCADASRRFNNALKKAKMDQDLETKVKIEIDFSNFA